MADILEIAPSMGQREEIGMAIAKAVVEGDKFSLLEPNEILLVRDVLDGRAVTTGRFAILKAMEKKYILGEPESLPETNLAVVKL